MHNKNNNKNQNFIQGLDLFQAQFQDFKKTFKKGGYNYSNIVDNWTKMVVKKFLDAVIQLL